jgi:regulator of protease activity HflC (stomatin/prohibitin superfamily)
MIHPQVLSCGLEGNAALVVLTAFVVLVTVIIVKGFRIVQQAETVVIERLGKYHKTLASGVNIIIPIIDKPREITWRYVESDPRGGGLVYYRVRKVERIDLRETVYDFPKQNVITKDNVTIEINALLYFQITDPVRAVYEIANLPDAIEKLTQTTMRNVIGEMDLDHTLSSRDHINTKLRAILDEAADKWGVKVNRVELQDINPPAAIREDMEKQMRAERERRANVLQAEGFKAAAILKAEGQRQAYIQEAEGSKQAAILSAEGKAEATVRIANAEAQAMKIVMDAVGAKGDPVQYLVAVKYIESLKEMAASPQKTVFMPVEASAVMGSLGALKKMFDAEGGSTPPVPPVPPVRRV